MFDTLKVIILFSIVVFCRPLKHLYLLVELGWDVRDFDSVHDLCTLCRLESLSGEIFDSNAEAELSLPYTEKNMSKKLTVLAGLRDS